MVTFVASIALNALVKRGWARIWAKEVPFFSARFRVQARFANMLAKSRSTLIVRIRPCAYVVKRRM